MIVRKPFFANIRMRLFDGSMSQGQVSGIDTILDEWEKRNLPDLRWLAYMLATTLHETARTMQPVMETRQAKEDKNPSVDTAIHRLDVAWANGKMPWVKKAYWRKDKDGLSWLGRGLPQVTHRYNYEKAEKKTGVLFTVNPDLMLEIKNAVPVMFDGMIEGWFTGKKLSDYFTQTKSDWKNARRIINGVESADKVKNYALRFHGALMVAPE